jgi:hypothetical protein
MSGVPSVETVRSRVATAAWSLLAVAVAALLVVLVTAPVLADVPRTQGDPLVFFLLVGAAVGGTVVFAVADLLTE